MDILLSLAAFLFALIGIIGCIVPIIPGIILTFGGLLCAYGCSYSTMEASTIWLWLGVTIVVSIIDYILPAYMTRCFGGSQASAIGATIGVIAGMFLGGIAGILIGPFLGAIIGELVHDSKDIGRAILAGIGSFFAFMVGTGIKLIAAVWMLLLIWADTWPVLREGFTSLF